MARSLTVQLRDGTAVARSLDEASHAVQRAIATMGYGATEWYGRLAQSRPEDVVVAGDVFDKRGVRVAYVSYNGRVWKADRRTLWREASRVSWLDEYPPRRVR